MKNACELIEQCEPFSTVMVVGPASSFPEDIVAVLIRSGVNVLGPVDTASRALTIAAQTSADLAIIHPDLSGRRDGFELAQRLEDTWGVRSVVIAAA